MLKKHNKYSDREIDEEARGEIRETDEINDRKLNAYSIPGVYQVDLKRRKQFWET